MIVCRWYKPKPNKLISFMTKATISQSALKCRTVVRACFGIVCINYAVWLENFNIFHYVSKNIREIEVLRLYLQLWIYVDQFCSTCDTVCAKLELQILKVSRFSVGGFMLAARLIRAHLEFCNSWGQTQWFLLF